MAWERPSGNRAQITCGLVRVHAAIIGVAPQRLCRVMVSAKRDVGRVARPGAEVADLLASRAGARDPAEVGGSALRMRIRQSLRILVATHNGESIEVAIAIAIV